MVLNVLNNEDCIQYMKTLPDNCVDLIIGDPPYFRVLKKESWDRFKTLEDYLQWSLEWINEAIRVLRFSGTLCLYGCTVNFNILCKLNSMLVDNGMYFVEEIIIDKGMKSVAGRINDKIKMLPPVSENILIYRKDAKPFVKNLLLNKQKELGYSTKYIKEQLGIPSNGGGNWTKYCGNTEFPLLPTREHWEKIRDLFALDITYNSIEETYNGIFGLTNVWSDISFYEKGRIHPSQKPVILGERLVHLFSNENDIVYVPFGGSGSEIIACIKKNRQWIATETSENYCQKILNRMKDLVD